MARPALVAVALLLLFSLASAARREPGFAADPSAQKTQVADAENMGVDEGCEGVTEDECLLRRTLTAHTDYIYTNKNDKP